jgi:hypothetical protein
MGQPAAHLLAGEAGLGALAYQGLGCRCTAFEEQGNRKPAAGPDPDGRGPRVLGESLAWSQHATVPANVSGTVRTGAPCMAAQGAAIPGARRPRD